MKLNTQKQIMPNLLAEHIMNIIKKFIETYNENIINEFGLTKEQLDPLWNKIMETYNYSLPKSTPKSAQKSAQKSNQKSTQKSTQKSAQKSTQKSEVCNTQNICIPVIKGCPYVFTKGKNVGKQCGCRAKGGRMYCSRHKKYEGKPSKIPKKEHPPVRKSIIAPSRKVNKKKTLDVILHKGPKGKLYHRSTGLVFNSDKIVIGTWLKAHDTTDGIDKILPLTQKDIETAKKHMFAFKTDEKKGIENAIRKVTNIDSTGVDEFKKN